MKKKLTRIPNILKSSRALKKMPRKQIWNFQLQIQVD